MKISIAMAPSLRTESWGVWILHWEGIFSVISVPSVLLYILSDRCLIRKHMIKRGKICQRCQTLGTTLRSQAPGAQVKMKLLASPPFASETPSVSSGEV